MMFSAKGIESSDAFRFLDETELNGIAGGRMKLEGPGHKPAPYGNGGGELIEATPWSSHPVYLGPF